MDIKKFLKPGKDIIIEIDETEYLVNDHAVASLERGDQKIDLIQLYDRQHYYFDLETVRSSFLKGIIDYLDKRD